MAIGDPISAPTKSLGAGVQPLSVVSDWVDICTAPETADNSGSLVVAPNAIARSDQHWLKVGHAGTTVQLRLKYDAGATPSFNPILNVFGRDANSCPQRLLDAGGGHRLTLAATAASDVSDGTYKYTPPVEVDADACLEILAAIEVAFAVSAGTVNNSTLQARVK